MHKRCQGAANDSELPFRGGAINTCDVANLNRTRDKQGARHVEGHTDANPVPPTGNSCGGSSLTHGRVAPFSCTGACLPVDCHQAPHSLGSACTPSTHCLAQVGCATPAACSAALSRRERSSGACTASTPICITTNRPRHTTRNAATPRVWPHMNGT